MMKSILSLFLLIGALYSADLSRDSNGIVTDISTNLQWQDNISSVKRIWSEAINYCEALSLGGQDDWRLPNINELFSIADFYKAPIAIKENIFQNINFDSFYWSSNSAFFYIGNIDNPILVPAARTITFYTGLPDMLTKIDFYHVRCVRGGQ